MLSEDIKQTKTSTTNRGHSWLTYLKAGLVFVVATLGYVVMRRDSYFGSTLEGNEKQDNLDSKSKGASKELVEISKEITPDLSSVTHTSLVTPSEIPLKPIEFKELELTPIEAQEEIIELDTEKGIHIPEQESARIGRKLLSIGSQFRVDASSNRQNEVAVMKYPNDNFLVMWTPEASNGTKGVRFDSAGNQIGNIIQISTNSPGCGNDPRQGGPQAAVSDIGTLLVVWHTQCQTGYTVYGRFYDASFTPGISEFQISAVGSQGWPSVAYVPSIGFVVEWETGATTVFARVYSSVDGNPIGPIYTVTDCCTNFPVVVSGFSDGGYVVVFGQYGIQKYNSTNHPSGSINSIPGIDSPFNRFSVTKLFNDQLMIVWSLYNVNGTASDIYGQYVDVGAVSVNLLGNQFQINAHMPGFQANPSVTTLSSGGTFIVWDDGSKIWGRRFDASKNPIGDDIVITNGKTPHVVGFNNNNFAVFWDNPLYAEIFNELFQLQASTYNITYVEKAPPLIIDNGILITGPDTHIENAVVAITFNFNPNADVLFFTDQHGISGNYNNYTGILTLLGNANATAYQTALRNVTFETVGNEPTAVPRTITFTVNNLLDSNTVFRTMNVIPVSDPPLAGVSSSTSENLPPDNSGETNLKLGIGVGVGVAMLGICAGFWCKHKRGRIKTPDDSSGTEHRIEMENPRSISPSEDLAPDPSHQPVLAKPFSNAPKNNGFQKKEETVYNDLKNQGLLLDTGYNTKEIFTNREKTKYF